MAKFLRRQFRSSSHTANVRSIHRRGPEHLDRPGGPKHHEIPAQAAVCGRLPASYSPPLKVARSPTVARRLVVQ